MNNKHKVHNTRPRLGWKESFEAMAQARDDKLLDADLLPEDTDEWEWPSITF